MTTDPRTDPRHRLFVTDEGPSASDAVVMLHGLGGTTSMFEPQADAMRSSTRVVRLDLAGSGRSAHRGPLSVRGWADDVAAVLDELEVETAVVVAHSLGTLVAAELAAQRPTLVRALIDLGPVRAQPDPVKQATRERAQLVRSEGMAAVVAGVLTAAVSETARRDDPVVTAFVRESLLAQDPDGYAASCEALADAEDPDWSALSMPVWLVSGEADKLAVPALVDTIADRLPHARREVVHGAGHWLTVEAPNRVTDIVTAAVATGPTP